MNTIDISYDNNSYKALAPRKTVVDYLNLVLAELGLFDVEFSVSFIEEEHMHQLNMEFRSINDSTDILSFAAEDDDGFGFEKTRSWRYADLSRSTQTQCNELQCLGKGRAQAPSDTRRPSPLRGEPPDK